MSVLFFIKRLPGPLARRIQLQDAFFSFFTEIGSQHARDILVARLARAASDSAAQHFREETGGGQEALTLADVQANLQLAIADNTGTRNSTRILRLVRKTATKQQAQQQQVSRLLHRVNELETRIFTTSSATQQNASLLHRLGELEANVSTSLLSFQKQSSVPVIFALQRLESRIASNVQQTLRNHLLSIRVCVADVINANITSPTSRFIEALRSAVKRPAQKSSPQEMLFPGCQKRGEEERSTRAWLQLAAVANSELAAERQRLGLAPRTLSYGAWKQLRGRVGQALKHDRLRRYALGPGHADFCARPLLWDRVAGGPAYVMLADDERHVRAVLKQFASQLLTADEATLSAGGAEPWPLNRDDALYSFGAEDNDATAKD